MDSANRITLNDNWLSDQYWSRRALTLGLITQANDMEKNSTRCVHSDATLAFKDTKLLVVCSWALNNNVDRQSGVSV